MIAIIIVVLLVMTILLYRSYRVATRLEREAIKEELKRFDAREKASEHLQDLEDVEDVEEINLQSANKQNDITKLKRKITKKEDKYNV